MQSGEGLTSFDKHSSAYFSSETKKCAMKLSGVSIFRIRENNFKSNLCWRSHATTYETRMFHKELCTADHDRNTLNFIEGKKS